MLHFYVCILQSLSTKYIVLLSLKLPRLLKVYISLYLSSEKL